MITQRAFDAMSEELERLRREHAELKLTVWRLWKCLQRIDEMDVEAFGRNRRADAAIQMRQIARGTLDATNGRMLFLEKEGV